MKKWRIEYAEVYRPSPLSFWVHRHLDAEVWAQATQFDPQLPEAVPGRGFPVLVVDALGTELRFASIEEVEHFLEIFGRKNMPTPLQLTKKRRTWRGPNGHWLSRLPAGLKPWKKREKIIPIVVEGLQGLKALSNHGITVNLRQHRQETSCRGAATLPAGARRKKPA